MEELNGIQVTKRLRHNRLQYVRIYDERDIEDEGFNFYVYCYETGLLIGCAMGEHFLAITEHVADFLERTGQITFEEDERWFPHSREISEDLVFKIDDFIMHDLKLYGSDGGYDCHAICFP